jgi:hypothetical protein
MIRWWNASAFRSDTLPIGEGLELSVRKAAADAPRP